MNLLKYFRMGYFSLFYLELLGLVINEYGGNGFIIYWVKGNCVIWIIFFFYLCFKDIF